MGSLNQRSFLTLALCVGAIAVGRLFLQGPPPEVEEGPEVEAAAPVWRPARPRPEDRAQRVIRGQLTAGSGRSVRIPGVPIRAALADGRRLDVSRTDAGGGFSLMVDHAHEVAKILVWDSTGQWVIGLRTTAALIEDSRSEALAVPVSAWGRVVDSTGTPLPDGRLSLQPGGALEGEARSTVFLDDEARFVLVGRYRGRYRFRATGGFRFNAPPTHGPRELEIDLPAWEGQDIVLAPARMLHCRFVDRDGAVIENPGIVVRVSQQPRAYAFGHGSSKLVGPLGEGTVVLEFEGGGLWWAPDPIEVSTDIGEVTVVLELRGVAEVSGQLAATNVWERLAANEVARRRRSTDWAGPGGGTVLFVPHDDPASATYVHIDEEGSFEARGLVPGVWTVSAQHPIGLHASTEVVLAHGDAPKLQLEWIAGCVLELEYPGPPRTYRVRAGDTILVSGHLGGPYPAPRIGVPSGWLDLELLDGEELVDRRRLQVEVGEERRVVLAAR